LFRHGKAESQTFDGNDFQRALQERGRKEVEETARKILQSVQVDLVVSSTANRTEQTAKIVMKILKLDKENLIPQEILYNASMQNLLFVVNQLPGHADTVVLVGHNPSLEFASEYFSGKFNSALRTSEAVWLQFPFEHWSMLSENTADLKFYWQR